MYAWITKEKLTEELTLSVVNVTWWEKAYYNGKYNGMVAYQSEYYKGTPEKANEIVEMFRAQYGCYGKSNFR